MAEVAKISPPSVIPTKGLESTDSLIIESSGVTRRAGASGFLGAFRAHFDTLAELTADTSLSYSSGDGKFVVAAGDYVTAGTQSYVVISSGGTAHETTAGSVKLMEAGPGFSTRARLVDWYDEGYTAQDGTIVSAAGVFYEADSGDTSISDLNGWKLLFDSANIVATINAQTGTTYTLVIGDANNGVTMNNASANTLTVPAESSVDFPVGTVIPVVQLGAGATTITGATGVSINGVSAGSSTLTEQHSAASLLKIASDSWNLAGDRGTVS